MNAIRFFKIKSDYRHPKYICLKQNDSSAKSLFSAILTILAACVLVRCLAILQHVA